MIPDPDEAAVMATMPEFTGTAVRDESKGVIDTQGTREFTDEQKRVVEEANRLIVEAYNMLHGENDPLFTEIMPVGRVQWIHIDYVQANDYNPNAVAQQEMKLLHTSISSDGYTQPVVAIWDPEAQGGEGRYIIVDGYHRYTTMKRYADIYDATAGYLPVVVLFKSAADRIASTVRHNRARGKHSVAGMSNLVFQMLMAGEDDATICNKIGLEAEELARLKHVTGYSKLYANREYTSAVMTKTQATARATYAKETGEKVEDF
jgi:ParB-like chromosome segregation protein Spo0J